MTIDSLGPLPAARPERAYTGSAVPARRPGAEPAAAATAARDSDAPTPTSELSDAVAKLNDSMQARSQSLEFSIDTDSKRTIVKVVDLATKEVVRQIPTEEALQISKSLEKFSGMLIQQKA